MSKAPSDLEQGDKVSWNWGSGQPSGKVEEVHCEDAEIETKRGNTIKKKGDEEDPAVEISQGKGKSGVLKKAHELNEVDVDR